MNKSKLEVLLDAIKAWNILKTIDEAYNAYMEERKTLPQAGDEIEIKNVDGQDWQIRKFIGFKKNGEIITENEGGYVGTWKHYRIPTPKKKWKVVKDSDGFRLIFPFDHPTDIPIITTFED
jgi:hypothetical protein